jgi:hypothetical protein
MSFTEIMGWVATLVTIVGALAPQRKNLHLSMAIANGLWLWYAVLRSDAPLAVVGGVLTAVHLWAMVKRK